MISLTKGTTNFKLERDKMLAHMDQKFDIPVKVLSSMFGLKPRRIKQIFKE